MLFFRNVNTASTHHSTRWATLRPGCMWFVVSCSLGAYIKACWWMDGCWFSAWWIWRSTLMVTIDTVLLNSTPVCYYGMAQHLPPLLSSISRKVLKAQRCSHLLCDMNDKQLFVAACRGKQVKSVCVVSQTMFDCDRATGICRADTQKHGNSKTCSQSRCRFIWQRSQNSTHLQVSRTLASLRICSRALHQCATRQPHQVRLNTS